jgi:hypothetical protein
MVVDAVRPPRDGWTSEQLLPQRLDVAVGALRNSGCDAFSWNSNPGTLLWHREIDSTVLATLSGVPTVDGYTSEYPIGYPTRRGSTAVNRSDLVIRWAVEQGLKGNICQVSDGGLVTVVRPTP